MAAEKSNFEVVMTDNEGNIFKGNSSTFVLNRTDDIELLTPSNSRKGFWYNISIENWKTWTLALSGETIALTGSFLAVVDTEGL